jgi:ribosomal protein S18 acetylase RimI-like enzyme
VVAGSGVELGGDNGVVISTELARRIEGRLEVRRVARADWGWISEWFSDAELDRRLGPLDEQWLEHVLSDREGVQLVVESGKGVPVALIGCAWAPDGLGHVVTDIAVNPRLRRSGIGRQALASAITWDAHPPTKDWIAFVDPDNDTAFSFFSAIGWSYKDLEDGMHRFCLEV